MIKPFFRLVAYSRRRPSDRLEAVLGLYRGHDDHVARMTPTFLFLSWVHSLPLLQGVIEDEEEEQDAKAADEAEMTGQTAPDKLRAELRRRKKEAEQ